MFFGYSETQKGYRCYDLVSYRLHIYRNVVFWEHRSFVKLSHFCTSLSSFSVLELFPDEAHIPSVAAYDPFVATLDSPVDFSVQPPDILNLFPNSPFNKQVEDELPTLSLGPLLLLRLKILHKTFYLVTQLE